MQGECESNPKYMLGFDGGNDGWCLAACGHCPEEEEEDGLEEMRREWLGWWWFRGWWSGGCTHSSCFAYSKRLEFCRLDVLRAILAPFVCSVLVVLPLAASSS